MVVVVNLADDRTECVLLLISCPLDHALSFSLIQYGCLFVFRKWGWLSFFESFNHCWVAKILSQEVGSTIGVTSYCSVVMTWLTFKRNATRNTQDKEEERKHRQQLNQSWIKEIYMLIFDILTQWKS